MVWMRRKKENDKTNQQQHVKNQQKMKQKMIFTMTSKEQQQLQQLILILILRLRLLKPTIKNDKIMNSTILTEIPSYKNPSSNHNHNNNNINTIIKELQKTHISTIYKNEWWINNLSIIMKIYQDFFFEKRTILVRTLYRTVRRNWKLQRKEEKKDYLALELEGGRRITDDKSS